MYPGQCWTDGRVDAGVVLEQGDETGDDCRDRIRWVGIYKLIFEIQQ